MREIEAYLRSEVSLGRYLHSLRVAKTTVMLCERFGLSPEEGWSAGMCHDLAREWPEERIIAAAEQDGREITAEERRVPLLMHGRAAAEELRQRYGERREAVLQAVRWHTTGHPRMGRLGMALYAADYIEPGRGHMHEELYGELLRSRSLEELTLSILTMELAWMREKGRTIVPYSYELERMLREGNSPAAALSRHAER
jgi:nicotinate-nucleotide adenylyltransferase